MDFEPKVTIDRFAKLTAGDLFIFQSDTGSCVAFKAIDKQNDGDELIVPLGPHLPAHCGAAQFIGRQNITVISFRKDYFIRFHADPGSWTVQPPDSNKIAFVLRDQKIYLRANYSNQENDFRPCLVDLSDGSILFGGWQNSIQAFVTSGSIATHIDPALAEEIFKF